MRHQFTVSVDGPPTFSLSTGTYPLVATLHFHATAPSQIITFNIFGTPLHQHAALGSYRFRHLNAGEEGADVVTNPPMLELADFPISVCAENDFATVSTLPGCDTVRRQIALPNEIYRLSVGQDYRLYSPPSVVSWWDNGPMEVDPHPAVHILSVLSASRILQMSKFDRPKCETTPPRIESKFPPRITLMSGLSNERLAFFLDDLTISFERHVHASTFSSQSKCQITRGALPLAMATAAHCGSSVVCKC